MISTNECYVVICDRIDEPSKILKTFLNKSRAKQFCDEQSGKLDGYCHVEKVELVK